MRSIKYLAGFFDGEGSITIERTHPENRPGPQYRLECAASQVAAEVLEEFQRRFGGAIRQHWCGSHQIREWRIRSQEAYRFLTQIIKNLWMKKPQAKLGLIFKCLQNQRHSNAPLELTELKEKCYRKMRVLNKAQPKRRSM